MSKKEVRVVSLVGGDTIDEFIVEETIGKGLSNTAVAYKVKEEAVIKLYVSEINATKDDLRYEKFKNEASLLRIMDGAPNVLRPLTDFREYAVHQNEKKLAPYYAMELMDGSLERLVIDDLSFRDKLEIALQVVQGTIDCHEKNICHRDLYTPNILYKQDKNGIVCKIADFGSAKRHGVGQPSPYFHPTGNLMYTSPEAAVGLLGGDKPDLAVMKAADIFSLGLLLYEVFTGLKQERLNSALRGIVILAQSQGLWDEAMSHDDRKEHLRRVLLPLLQSIKVDAVTVGDILEGEEIATKLNDLIMSMISFDYTTREKDLVYISKQLSSMLAEDKV